MNKIKNPIDFFIFQSKWILLPFYIGLIIAQVFYSIKFGIMVFEFIKTWRGMDENQFLLIILTLVDATMVANLIKMIISGSYQTFIHKIDNDHTEKVSSGQLKVKMGMSLLGISSIHLLTAFINVDNLSIREITLKCIIHLIFLFSTVGLAFIDYLHNKCEHNENNHETK